MTPTEADRSASRLSAHVGLVIPLHACRLAVLPSEWLGSGLSVSFFFAHLGRLLGILSRASLASRRALQASLSSDACASRQARMWVAPRQNLCLSFLHSPAANAVAGISKAIIATVKCFMVLPRIVLPTRLLRNGPGPRQSPHRQPPKSGA